MLNTGKFDFGEAIASPVSLSSLHEMTVMHIHGKKRIAPKPETLEYGIGSFVYRARRSFDPLTLYRALEANFILIQDELDDGETEDDANSTSGTDAGSSGSSDNTKEKAYIPVMDTQEILANKKNCPCFDGLLEYCWREVDFGIRDALVLHGIPSREWMADEDTVRSVEADFEGEWGDRRQELVFIGEKLGVEGLRKKFDGCLLSRAELRKWERIMHDKSLSGEDKEEMLQEAWDDSYWSEWVRAEHEEGEEHDHSHHNHGPGYQDGQIICSA